jgi:uncharacterized cupredoxin-like copper-binding protein
VAALVAAQLLLAGCSSDEREAESRSAASVVEKDFNITAPKTIAAGDVDIAVKNLGPVSHELIVARGTAADLPLRHDAVTVDEDAIEPRIVGALEPVGAGVHELDLNLEPGRYVLLCNMNGHYRSGMHTEVVVR